MDRKYKEFMINSSEDLSRGTESYTSRELESFRDYVKSFHPDNRQALVESQKNKVSNLAQELEEELRKLEIIEEESETDK